MKICLLVEMNILYHTLSVSIKNKIQTCNSETEILELYPLMS